MKPLTPLEEYPALGRAVGFPTLFFKREDLHPYGSHKGRSIPVMIETYYAAGDRNFAVSSSGNAALAAALFIKRFNDTDARALIGGAINLEIYVGQHVAPAKFDRLQDLADEHIRVFKKERPLVALAAATAEGKRSLRQSTDDLALAGYKELAAELDEIKNLSAIFLGTSSGTTAQALAQYWSTRPKPVQVHIVQTSSCHPLAAEFESYAGPDEKSTADAIVDQTANRKTALIPLLEKTGGHGWIAANEDIETAQKLTEKYTKLKISPNGALAVAGAMQAAYTGVSLPGAVVCLICGQ